MISSQLSSALCHVHIVDSLLLLGENLGLEGVGSGEVDGDLVGGDLVVDLGHGLNLGLNLFLVEGVKEDLNVLLTVKGDSGGLASDGGGVADIFQNGSVDCGQSSASRSLLSSVSLSYRDTYKLAQSCFNASEYDNYEVSKKGLLVVNTYPTWK
jgi:hypothetical protein